MDDYRREQDGRGRRHLYLFDEAAEKLATPYLEDEFFATEKDSRIDDTVQELLDGLKPAHKEILYKRFFDRMTFGDIAAERGCSRQAVHRQCERALTNLMVLIAKRGNEVFYSKGAPNEEEA